MAGKVSGIALGALGAGGLFLYAGITGKDLAAAIKSIVQGTSPATAPQTHPITSTAATGGGLGSVTGVSSTQGAAIASDALQYVGKLGWSWGGSMASGKPDCSGYANGVIGRDMGLAIPGFAAGTFDGSQHGPATITWIAWNGCVTIGHQASQAQAGDLCVWQTHMGIATGGGQMVSDRDAQLGVGTGPISMPGEILFVRRLKQTTTAGGRSGQ